MGLLDGDPGIGWSLGGCVAFNRRLSVKTGSEEPTSQGKSPKGLVLLWGYGRASGSEESGSASYCICRAGVGEQEFREQRKPV